MSDFWNGITGDKKDAFSSSVTLIPDNTYVNAFIDNVVINESEIPHIEIKWKIFEGEYKNRLIWHKLHILDQKPERARRARNMLMMLMNMFNIPVPTAIPTINDLYPLKNKNASILIGQYAFPQPDGNVRTGNYVREVHPLSSVEIQEKSPESSRNFDDDIPF